jgi:hypothetical protein
MQKQTRTIMAFKIVKMNLKDIFGSYTNNIFHRHNALRFKLMTNNIMIVSKTISDTNNNGFQNSKTESQQYIWVLCKQRISWT